MNWYKIANLIDPQVQQQFIGWGKAQNIPENIIKQEIQRLIQIEEQKKPQLTPRDYEYSTWVKKQFGKFIQDYKNIPQHTIQQDQQDQKEDSPIIRKAKGINQQYFQWVLEVWQQNPRQEFDQSIFDYFKGSGIDPLDPFLSYVEFQRQSDQWHKERYEKSKSMKYKTPVTAGEQVGDMFMVTLTEEDEVAEGKNMQNCIGDMCFVGPDNDIYSLRDKKNRPHVSIEIKDGKVSQIKGKQNKTPVPVYINYIVKWFLMHPEIDLGKLDGMRINKQQILMLIDRLKPDTLLDRSVAIGSWDLTKKAIDMGAKNYIDILYTCILNDRLDFLKFFVEEKKTNILATEEEAVDREEFPDMLFFKDYGSEFAFLNYSIDHNKFNIIKYIFEQYKKLTHKQFLPIIYFYRAMDINAATHPTIDERINNMDYLIKAKMVNLNEIYYKEEEFLNIIKFRPQSIELFEYLLKIKPDLMNIIHKHLDEIIISLSKYKSTPIELLNYLTKMQKARISK